MQWVVRNPFSLSKGKPKNLQENNEQQKCSEPQLQEDPVELLGSHEVLVRIPRAAAHLVEEEESIELGRGEFTLIRLLHGNTGLAILAKVGDELSWPITKDQPTVKVDSCHYLFSVPVPTVEETTEPAKFGRNCGSEILNYGVSFEEKEGLELLDKCLEQHACFSCPKDGGKPASDRENSEAAYWADLAPKVEDYNSILAKAIASGSGQIIRGLFQCSNAYSSQVQKGGEFVRSTTKAKGKPCEVRAKRNSEISPRTKRNIRRVKNLSKMSEKMSNNVLKGVITASGAVTGPVITSKAGRKFFAMLPGEVLLASLDAINKLMEALEVAGKDALSATSEVTSEIIAHRFGEDAGEVTQEAFEVAGHALGTAMNVIKIRKAINPATNGNVSASVIKNSFKEINKAIK
ncbi:hypothetical protein SUGI_0484840 [Cryptomeria japonica]|nr:hypothetical protein SUGI_0484840 [Cryptomeria japonica]